MRPRADARLCPSCRGLILSDFRFCPYCGAKASAGPGLEEALEESFSRIEGSSSARGREARRLAELEKELARLESEMDLLLEELERAPGGEGRSPAL